LVAIYTQPDRPSGRGKKIQPNAIKTWAIEHNVPVHQPEKPNQNDTQWLLDNQIDLTLVMAYGHILKQDLLDAAKIDTLNLHASLLPKYRGASPIETALACGEDVTGVTLMKITKRMDSGPILDQEEVTIENQDTGSTLREKISQACVPLLERNWDKIISNNLVFNPQNDSKVSYCRKLTKNDVALDFKQSAKILSAKIRALSFWPKCSFIYNGTDIKCGMATHSEEGTDATPGTIIGLDKNGLEVATEKGTLVISQLQKPGGKMLEAGDFLRGFPIEKGAIILSQESPPLTQSTQFKTI
jgi:methionyl-tRNA formyltransferase